MELGICVASKIDDLDYVVEAERLGFTHAWLADSQMIWSDVYASLAVAAERTSTIRLGTGVAVAATRPVGVTAAAIATINELAPGRTFLGIGTGNTAMRIMGHPPMRITEFDDYLRALGPLMRGEEAPVTWRGVTSPVRHIMPDAGFVAFEPRIPLYVSGFGPRSLALAGAHGDGAVLSIPPQPEAMERVWRAIEAGASAAGRTIDRERFHTCTLTTIVVLDDDETIESPRVFEQCGAFAVAGLHYAYEQWRNFGRRPSSPAMLEVWDDYVAVVERVPESHRHQRIHEGHNCWVVPEEVPFVTTDLMASSCMIGTAEQLRDRLADLDAAGLDQVMILPPLEPRYDVIRRVGADLITAL